MTKVIIALIGTGIVFIIFFFILPFLIIEDWYCTKESRYLSKGDTK